MTVIFSRKSVIWVLVMLLLGCDRQFAPEAMFDAYIQDLNRSAHVQIDVAPEMTLQALPALRERQQALSQFDVGLLEFLSLQQCEVGALAGQRNSILGRVMPASQRFVYELDIIRAIRQCDIEDSELHSKLNDVARVKASELPITLSNLLWAGEETGAFFSLSNGYLPMAPERSQYQALIAALQHLQRLNDNLADIPKVSSAAIEADMQAIYESEYLGKLLYSITHISAYLESVTQAVQGVSEQSDMCGAPLTFLRQQFERHYIDLLQPYMARINRAAYQVLPLVNKLADSSPIQSEAWRSFIQQFDDQQANAPWQRYLRASREHGQAWSRLFALCGEGVGAR
ncbi:DUF3080 family protein [Marinomonas ostreistagni]|uniref:DUF3080 family protein n=1 Tax=Marinomonas ostreistagni TaxID=359209 RepID=UPI00194E5C91|nr:DUF3080 family protein [Marinomonas ostreistagni]MBM6551483.1 DUF3080 domain-containing protein [Marinomonas ostreistagni]